MPRGDAAAVVASTCPRAPQPTTGSCFDSFPSVSSRLASSRPTRLLVPCAEPTGALWVHLRLRAVRVRRDFDGAQPYGGKADRHPENCEVCLDENASYLPSRLLRQPPTPRLPRCYPYVVAGRPVGSRVGLRGGVVRSSISNVSRLGDGLWVGWNVRRRRTSALCLRFTSMPPARLKAPHDETPVFRCGRCRLSRDAVTSCFCCHRAVS